MLKFFRKIRQQLLQEGSFQKYLLYAIGEIALVMIGILLALQVNNWNENRKKLSAEKTILKAIHSDFVAAKKELLNCKGALLYQKDHLIPLIDLCKPSSSKIRQTEVDSLIRNSYALPTFDPAFAVLEDLINTGRIEIIQDTTLRALLSTWQGLLEESKRQELHQGDFLYNRFTPFIEERIEFKHKWFAKDYQEVDFFEVDSRLLLGDFKFCNLLKRAHYWNYWVEKEYAVLEEKMDSIIQLTKK